MEITTKSSQSIYEMCKFMNFRNLMKKLEKTAECSFKKLIFGQTSMKFDGCYGNVKTYGHVIDISKFPQRMKEQLLKVSASQSESPFQIRKKKSAGRLHPTPPLPPIVRPLCSVRSWLT